MSSINKKSPGARGIPQPFNRQAAHAPQFKPAVAQLKTGVSAQSVKGPVAPPVYRPQQTPNALQPKVANGAVKRNPPSAPPVYRPQSKPQIVQQKTAVPSAGRTLPVAPPVYRPQTLPKVLQTKQSIAAQAQPPIAARKPMTAPPAYHPNNSPRIVQPHNSAGGGQKLKPHHQPSPVPQAQPSLSNSIQRQQPANSNSRGSSSPVSPAKSVIQRYTRITDGQFRGKMSENGHYVTGNNLSEIYVLPGNNVEMSYNTQRLAVILGVTYEIWKPNFNVIGDCVAAMEEILHGKKLKYGVPDVSEYRDMPNKRRKIFGVSDEANRKRGVATDLREDANPGVGEGYVIARQSYKRDEERPQFHGAAVVAQDGDDNVTLEATAPEQGEIEPNRVTPVYDMYGRDRKRKQSFKIRYQAEYGKDATVSVVKAVKSLPAGAFAPQNSERVAIFKAKRKRKI